MMPADFRSVTKFASSLHPLPLPSPSTRFPDGQRRNGHGPGPRQAELGPSLREGLLGGVPPPEPFPAAWCPKWNTALLHFLRLHGNHPPPESDPDFLN